MVDWEWREREYSRCRNQMNKRVKYVHISLDSIVAIYLAYYLAHLNSASYDLER